MVACSLVKRGQRPSVSQPLGFKYLPKSFQWLSIPEKCVRVKKQLPSIQIDFSSDEIFKETHKFISFLTPFTICMCNKKCLVVR